VAHQWQIHEAKNRLSEVLREAATSGPQTITVRGKETAVILSIKDWRRLTKPASSLVEFLRSSPLAEVELDLDRSPDTGRDVSL
jgi:prevent-host-death family protein